MLVFEIFEQLTNSYYSSFTTELDRLRVLAIAI